MAAAGPTAGRPGPFTGTLVEVLHEIDAVGAVLLLRVPRERALRAAAAAVTALGSGVVERVSLDDEYFASARAYRQGRTMTALSIDVLAGHPELSAFAPFPYAVAAVPVYAGGEQPVGSVTAFWQRPYGHPQEWERAGLERAARALSAELLERRTAGTEPVPPPVPDVVPGDTGFPEGTQAIAPHLFHLHKLAVALAATTETPAAVDVTLERLRGGFGAVAAVITSLHGRTLRVLGQYGCSPAFRHTLDGATSGGGLPEAEALGTPLQRVLAPDDPRTAGRLAAEAVPELRDGVFWVVVPLLSGRRAVGTCSVAFDTVRGRLIAEQSVLTALTTLLGQTLERARMLAGQHTLAARLQRLLLPGRLAAHPLLTAASRYVSATSGIEIGGDWYEMLRLPDGGTLLVIGDVEGHNVSAAVVMGQLRSAMRAYAAEGHDPGTLLSRSDRLLVGLDTDLFATCCCVLLDPEPGAARIASAGHPAPLLCTADGRCTPLEVEPGPPLGISRDPVAYPVREFALDPGSLLALYTDGLPTAVDGELPPAALEQALAAGHGLESMCDALTRPPSGPRTHHDDAALLLVRYEGWAAARR